MKEHPYLAYRKDKKLTQSELATLLNISVASISRIESGKQKVLPALALLSEEKTRGKIKRLDLLYPDSIL